MKISEIELDQIKVAPRLREIDKDKVDDLVELSINVVGEDDGVFNNSDKILFFGESPHIWHYDQNSFIHTKNIYSFRPDSTKFDENL